MFVIRGRGENSSAAKWEFSTGVTEYREDARRRLATGFGGVF